MTELELRARQFYAVNYPLSPVLPSDYNLSLAWLKYARLRDLKTPLPFDLANKWQPVRPEGLWVWNSFRVGRDA